MKTTKVDLVLPDGKTVIWGDFKGQPKKFIRRNGREMRYLLLREPKVAAAYDLSITILVGEKGNSLKVIPKSRDCYFSCNENCAACDKLPIMLVKMAFQKTFS